MKTKRASLHLISLLPWAGLLLAACTANTADPAAVSGPAEASLSGTARGHILPMPSASPGFAGAVRGAARPAAYNGQAGNGNVHMTYRGGPVISNVKVYAVFWNSTVQNQSKLASFYGAITDSAYMDWLSEYDTSTQHIGRGTFAGSVVDTGAPTSSHLTDDQVQQELKRLLDNGALAAPDANTLYMIHFPAGVNITMDNATSCQQFCAYHSSFQRGSANVYYGVMPDFSGACASCGGAGNKMDNTTVVTSHEVIEAITDPNIGVANATQDEHQLAWYDDQNSEIGDVCQGDSTMMAGFMVTKGWSNKASACIAQASSSGSGTGGTGGTGGGGTGGGGTGGSGGSGGSGGTGGSGGSGGSGGGDPGCSHPICSTGAPLAASCGPCTEWICENEPRCCSKGWDPSCVWMAAAYCGKPCY